MLFGAHMPAIGGVHKALERGHEIGCQVVQVFVKNNMQWQGKVPEPSVVDQFEALREQHHFACVFGHTGYLINLGAPPSPNRDKSIQSLIQEIGIATGLGLPFLVLHPGAHLGQGDDAGFTQIINGLDEVFRSTPDSPVRIALEITAGQGTCLGHRIEHLRRIYDGVACPARLGVCLDTAHLFAAGYDIRSQRGWEVAMGTVDKLLSFEQVLAVHLNDSKADLGSRVDRHAGIGLGHMGKAAFRHIVNDERLRMLPGCLETPKSPDLHEDVANLAILRSMVKRKSPARNPS